MKLYGTKLVEYGNENLPDGTKKSVSFGIGWYTRFSKRFNLKNCKVHGESGSVNTDGITEQFPIIVSEIINIRTMMFLTVTNLDYSIINRSSGRWLRVQWKAKSWTNRE